MTNPDPATELDALFRPKSIALVGASNDASRIGGIPLDYLIRYPYAGKVYPVNPKYETIQGLKAYPSLSAIGQPVDLAIFAVPAKAVSAAIDDAAAAGVKCAVMFSSGFAEVGEHGADAQQALTEQVQRAGIRLLGPNCLGFLSIREHIFSTFTAAMQRAAPPSGNIAIVSQSGAFGAYALQMAVRRGLGLSYWATTGNEGDIQVADCIEWLAHDDSTQVMLCYLEGCRDGERLKRAFAIARDNGKRIVMIKVGRTAAGGAAAASHTAALSGEDAVYDAMFRQYGVYRANSMDEFFAVGYAASVTKMPAGGRLGIMTVSGGVGALMADEASTCGLELPAMPSSAQAELRGMVPFCGPNNPVDITGHFQNEHQVFDKAIDLMAQSELFDALVVFAAATGLSPVYGPRVHESMQRARQMYPEMAMALVTMMPDEMRQSLDDSGCLFYEEPSLAVRAMAALSFYARSASQALPVQRPAATQALVPTDHSLNEHEALQVLGQAGISVAPSTLVGDAQTAVTAAQSIGYPVVMKIASADIGHKSDIGGVQLNIRNDAGAKNAYQVLLDNAATHRPDANIDGVLVSPMISGGVEMILGINRDPVFGPVVLCGLGGIAAEALRDTAIRVAPVDKIQARQMIDELQGRSILDGLRGAPPADVDALVDAIVALSEFATNQRQYIASIDINPFVVMPVGQGGMALDALIVPG
ncbi:MAG: acetate--CoA ligase family protein [Burkholderiaceae bacterium]